MKHVTHGDSRLCPDVLAGRATRCPGHDVLDVPERAREHLRHAIMLIDSPPPLRCTHEDRTGGCNLLVNYAVHPPRCAKGHEQPDVVPAVRARIINALAAIEEGNP